VLQGFESPIGPEPVPHGFTLIPVSAHVRQTLPATLRFDDYLARRESDSGLSLRRGRLPVCRTSPSQRACSRRSPMCCSGWRLPAWQLTPGRGRRAVTIDCDAHEAAETFPPPRRNPGIRSGRSG
jgi:hypothetical protein